MMTNPYYYLYSGEVLKIICGGYNCLPICRDLSSRKGYIIQYTALGADQGWWVSGSKMSCEFPKME